MVGERGVEESMEEEGRKMGGRSEKVMEVEGGREKRRDEKR